MEEKLKRTVGTNGIMSDKAVKTLLGVLALVMVGIHILYTQISFIDAEVYLACHIAFSYAIIFVLTIQKSKSKVHTIILMAALTLTAAFLIYIATDIEMLRARSWASTNVDVIVGAIMLVLAFYACYLGYGLLIPILVFLVVIYPIFGQYLPEPFTTTSYSFKKTIANLSIGLKTGLFDQATYISADFVFLFSVFGGLLGATGIQSFFYEFGKKIVGRFRSGSALIAMVNTALVGSVVGSGVANVAITGPYCISGMKEDGYTSVQSAAILSAGANGGQILPPVMGIIAFAMAGFSGVPYIEICKMALLPALIYYGTLCVYCALNAAKHPVMSKKITKAPEVDKNILKYKSVGFFVPFVLIIVLFAFGFSVPTVAFWAIISVIVTSVMTPKAYRPKFKDYIDGLIDGGISGAKVGCVCSVIGMLVATFTSSGLGIKLTSGIETWSGGSMFVALVILYITSIVAGMAGVSTAAYFTAAAFAVPVLLEMGIPYAMAHFFTVYPAAFSTITPPVALVSLVASKQAGSKYGPTAIESCKVAATGFLMPFLMVYAPAVCLMSDAANPWTWIDIVLVIVVNLAFQVVWCGHLFAKMSMLERVLLAIGCCATIVFFAERYLFLLMIGIVAMAAVLVVQFIRRPKNSGGGVLQTG